MCYSTAKHDKISGGDRTMTLHLENGKILDQFARFVALPKWVTVREHF